MCIGTLKLFLRVCLYINVCVCLCVHVLKYISHYISYKDEFILPYTVCSNAPTKALGYAPNMPLYMHRTKSSLAAEFSPRLCTYLSLLHTPQMHACHNTMQA